MRLPFQRRCQLARQSPSWASNVVALAALAPSFVNGLTVAPVPSPNLDFSNLGRIGLVGDFTGISLYEYEGQTERPRSSNGSEALLTEIPNGGLGIVVSTDASIRGMCTFTRKNGDVEGVVIGGNFTSLDGTQSNAIALFNITSAEVTPLKGIEGEVDAVLCDQDRDTVYVGGNFKGRNSTNALAWTKDKGWEDLPFAGFNGPVSAITKASNGHIIFGGTFTGLGNASAPSERDSQVINLSAGKISATGTTSKDGYDDPKSIICSDGKDDSGTTWLLEDKTAGSWEADFGFSFRPTMLRLWNTHKDGRGTKTFRFFSYPTDGILNLTYTDPDSGHKKFCESQCPMSSDEDYRDFHFVNEVEIDKFQILISAWYGDGAGLAGIELFQDDIFSYAITKFNEPSCSNVTIPASATTTGPWKESASLKSSSKYLVANLNSDYTSKSASVVFYPDVRESGNYSVNMYTPGCDPDNTCFTRGRVNVTGTMSTGDEENSFTTTLYQTNNFDKYDQIYFGYIEKTSDTFKPAVTLTPLAGQDVESLTIVAQRVGFTLMNSTGGLNGLFDFNPKDKVINMSSLTDSPINKLGSSFDPTSGVRSLVTAGDVTYVGGNFTSNDQENILAIIEDQDVKHLDGGLNGEVYSMYLNESNLFVGGDFSNKETGSDKGMKNVAVYDVDKKSWDALGAGVDGKVEYVVPLRINTTDSTPEVVISFSGVFSQCNAFDNYDAIPVDGFAIWVPSKNNWLQNLDGHFPGYSGILTTAILDLPDNAGSLFAGSVFSAQVGANGAVTLSDNGLGQFPVKIQAKSPSNSSNISRRDLLPMDDEHGVRTGLFYTDNKQNITILGGHFTARTTKGDKLENLVLVDGNDNDKIIGLGSDIASNSTFSALASRDNILFAGGTVSGTIDGSDVSGFITYDLVAKKFNKQPPSFSDANATVSAISVRPDSSEVYFGGSFANVGELECPGICTLDVNINQWNRPADDVKGSVNALLWTSNNNLVVGGNMVANDSTTQYLVSWDAKHKTWASFPGAADIPGPVSVLTLGSRDGKQIWISGLSKKDNSTYLMKYDGDQWNTVKPALGTGTILRNLQVFSLTHSHDKHDLLGDKQVLLLTGSIVVSDFGTASAVIFNGTTYEPYALTTNSGTAPGSIAAVFTQKDNFFSSEGGHMALGFIVLIGLAISLGLILILVLAGIILDRVRKRREGYVPAPTSMYDRGSGMQRVPPHELFGTLTRGNVPQV